MKDEHCSILDGNEAAVDVAYRLVENIAIYPITPSSTMAELSDEWASQGRLNLWGTVPDVVEMQSEGGAAGAVHGSLQAGTLTTTFTASQGLLLMIPNMYKIAGELTSMCMHVTARALATHALSIFGDHSDVMACRATGFSMLVSNSVQEAHDMACVGHVASMETRIPFLHFFDGFRTSHEVNTFLKLSDAQLRQMVDERLVREHRQRALSPDRPSIRGTAQNPDTFFQAREASNLFYKAAPEKVQAVMDRLAKVCGRQYKLFEYVGAADATKVIILMGSGAETAEETSAWLNGQGQKTGVLKIRLFRPFSMSHFIAALPPTVQKIAVLDRTKEPGSMGEPLYQDVLTAISEARAEGIFHSQPLVVSGRYGLGSKEFSPAMVKAVFDDLSQAKPKNHYSVGIEDDVTFSSLKVDESFDLESADVFRSIFIGLGADGTVGANKNTIKIIGDETDNYAQAYFVYDSKKSGAMTVSHLRFGPRPIRAPYLIKNAQFVGCHQFSFIEKMDILKYAAPGAVVLLNSTWDKNEVWNHIPWETQRHLIERKINLYVIDAYQVAKEAGMEQRINTIMQTCYFAISGILPREEAIAKIKKTIEKTYSKKGAAVVESNFKAVNATLANLHQVAVPSSASSAKLPDMVSNAAPDFVKRVTSVMMKGDGDLLPVSAFIPDGTWPTGTTCWEKRNIAIEVPQWDSSLCIQCNKCAMVCPHAAIRTKFYPAEALAGAPAEFHFEEFKAKEYPGHRFTIQVSPEDCTGCQLCSKVCPAKDKSNPKHKALDMVSINEVREVEQNNFTFFLSLPEPDVSAMTINVKSAQFRKPLFEYSGACTGCGETPYVKLLTQLFGDRVMMANATGCSSIYGGNLPTTPYCTNKDGRGPAWSNSLFEDNAEFGFGFRISLDQKQKMAKELLIKLSAQLGEGLVKSLLESPQISETEIAEQRHRVEILKQKLSAMSGTEAFMLTDLADNLVKKVVWVVGGDGWAYDIGYGGLDHVLASGRNINILVLDTEVYSNTGGQQSKSTPIGAVAKFAAAGKAMSKKDMPMLAMSYGNVYVASVAFGAKDAQTVQAFVEAESYDGPSIIFAYSHCIAHGYNLSMGLDQQKNAVDTGYWPLFRFDPRREGEPKLKMDSVAPKLPLAKYMDNEGRFKMLQMQNPERAKLLADMAQKFVTDRFNKYQALAQAGQPS